MGKKINMGVRICASYHKSFSRNIEEGKKRCYHLNWLWFCMLFHLALCSGSGKFTYNYIHIIWTAMATLPALCNIHLQSSCRSCANKEIIISLSFLACDEMDAKQLCWGIFFLKNSLEKKLKRFCLNMTPKYSWCLHYLLWFVLGHLSHSLDKPYEESTLVKN